jgi:hypothetical protein
MKANRYLTYTIAQVVGANVVGACVRARNVALRGLR